VFLLFFIDEYSHKEIADFLSISEVASRARVFKAREILQKQLIEAGIYSK
jgi:RNA polymerase sigma-70 factor (ECF subfamily)